MYYVQVCVVNDDGEQQNDALVTEFANLSEAFTAQGQAANAVNEVENLTAREFEKRYGVER